MKNSGLLLRLAASAAFVFGFCPSARSDAGSDRIDYVRKYSEIAVKEMSRSGVPASITLAQGILESGAGKSKLATEGNNHFGIKCHNWKGGKIYADDDRKNECFRKYRTAEESFRDHSDFLRYNDRYKFLFDLNPGDYKAWAFGLKKAGYATDSEYPWKLVKLIEELKLYEYDKVSGDEPLPETSNGERKGKNGGKENKSGKENKAVAVPPSPSVIETPVAIDRRQSETFRFNLSRKMYSLNGVAFVYAEKGDSYESLAAEYNLFKKEILRFNDLKQAEALQPGDIVYLQKKKNYAAKGLDKHVWNEGDDLRELSQRYAIRLSSLKKLNRGSDTFVEGDILKLRK